jgi:hypothetical protein
MRSFSFLVFLVTLCRAVAQTPCCLCGELKCSAFGNKGTVLATPTQTCNAKILEIAEHTREGSPQCSSARNSQFFNACCTNAAAPRIAAAPTPAPCSGFRQGPNPVCELCHGGKFPEKPRTITAILGVPGNPTCEDLYCMGQKGQITTQVCAPMRNFMDCPCGCYTRQFGSQCPEMRDAGNTNTNNNNSNNNNQNTIDVYVGDPNGVPVKRNIPTSSEMERISDNNANRGNRGNW